MQTARAEKSIALPSYVFCMISCRPRGTDSQWVAGAIRARDLLIRAETEGGPRSHPPRARMGMRGICPPLAVLRDDQSPAGGIGSASVSELWAPPAVFLWEKVSSASEHAATFMCVLNNLDTYGEARSGQEKSTILLTS